MAQKKLEWLTVVKALGRECENDRGYYCKLHKTYIRNDNQWPNETLSTVMINSRIVDINHTCCDNAKTRITALFIC